jgi:hypothetical protein
VLKVIATDAEFEYIDEIIDDDQWLSEQGSVEPEDDFSDWPEPGERSRTDRAPRRVPSPGWPRDARPHAQREAELRYEDDEPVAERRATRRVSESGLRPGADRALASSRTARRAAEPDPPLDPGRTIPRAARRPAAQLLPEARGPARPKAGRRPAEWARQDVDDRPVPRSARNGFDPDHSYGAEPASPRPARPVPRSARNGFDPDHSYGAEPDSPRRVRRASERARTATAGHGLLPDERTQMLIAQGRRSARGHLVRGRNVAVGVTIGVVLATVLTMIVFRNSASWPPSVAVVQKEIAAACQNPNVASEPNQVNFACGKGTDQVLWVFALMTSGDNPDFSDPTSGRKGLEPITPAQGGEVAWSLDLHHPYDPFDSIDSLEVAARAINNIIGGASLTATNGNPVVQSGLLSSPANCARYTGSSAVIARAGFPDICAQPVTSPAGQAALVADVYSQWLVGAPSLDAQEASILFQNANDPGNPQVQAILKTLPGATATN